MRRDVNALSLDLLGPIPVRAIDGANSMTDPLALDPLSPIDVGSRPIDALGGDQNASER
jgi:hypothetical protein